MVQVSSVHPPNQDPHGCTKGETQCPYRDARCFLCLWPPAAALCWRVVRRLRGASLRLSDRLNIGFISVGGYGIYALKNLRSENIVALCDVDWRTDVNFYAANRER